MGISKSVYNRYRYQLHQYFVGLYTEYAVCTKQLPVCPLTKSNLQALDFVTNRFFMKLFKTSNIDTVKYCQVFFGFDLPSVLWAMRVREFEVKFALYLSN